MSGTLADHPVFVWLGVILTFVAIISIAVTVWVYLEAERVRNETWMELDKSWNENQLHKLDTILETQSQLEVHGVRLTEIENLINRHWGQREDRFEELENEHKMLMQSMTDMYYRIGLHNGFHQKAGH